MSNQTFPASTANSIQTISNIKYLPYAFTEQGVAMLSGVLNSDKAINMNIAIMRAFVEVRKALLTIKTYVASKLQLALPTVLTQKALKITGNNLTLLSFRWVIT